MEGNELRLFLALLNLIQQVEEDIPREYMTKHLKTAIEDACELLNEISQGENNE
jgi:hypothetical protein